MLLSHLIHPEAVKSLSAGVVMLRKWQQNFFRVKELTQEWIRSESDGWQKSLWTVLRSGASVVVLLC